MTWAAWRLHRGHLVTIGLLFAGTYAALLLTWPLTHPTNRPGALIGLLPVIVVLVLPGAVGFMVAAPGLADELAQTWKLAWTQGATRSGWLRGHLVVITAAAVALGALDSAATALLFLLPRTTTADVWTNFDTVGLGPIGLALFGATLGMACAAWIRRPQAAILGATVIFLTARVLIPAGLIYGVMPPLAARTATVHAVRQPAAQGSLSLSLDGNSVPGLRVGSYAIDVTGHLIPGTENLQTSGYGGSVPPPPGIPVALVVRYLPDGAFPEYQVVELVACVLLAALLAGLTALGVRRRTR